MIVVSLMAATLGAVMVESANAQLFARLRARANTNMRANCGPGSFEGGGAFDRFDQNYSQVNHPSNYYPTAGYTTSVYGNSNVAYSTPAITDQPAYTNPNQVQGGVVDSSQNAAVNSDLAIAASAADSRTGSSNQTSTNQSGAIVYGAPGASSQNNNQPGSEGGVTNQSVETQQFFRTESANTPNANSPKNEAVNSGQSGENHRMTAADEAQAMSQFFAGKLVLCNNDEIQAAKHAAEKVSNPEVKSYAEMLVKDHMGLNEKLSKFLPVYAEKPMIGENRLSVAAGEEAGETRTSASSSGNIDSTYSRLYEVCRKASGFKQEQCEQMMSDYSAEQLDMAFVGSQMVGHQMLLAELKAIEASTSGEFQSLVREAKKGIESHLETARRLAEKLSSQEK